MMAATQREQDLIDGFNQGLLSPEMQADVEEAIRLGLLPEPDQQEERGFLDRFVTGRGRGRGDLPELGSLPDVPNAFALGIGFFTTPSEKARAGLLEKNIPGVKFREDEFGNTVVMLPDGREAFLNAPGFSQQDFADIISGIIKFIPAAKIAGAASTLVRRAGAAFLAGAGTSIAEDVAADVQGADAGIDPVRAGLTGLAGTGAEVIAPALKSAFLSLVKAVRTQPSLITKGVLTAEGRQVARKLGFDPDEISPELAEAITGKAAVPEATAFEFPLTTGEATGDAAQLAREQSLRIRGDKAGAIVRSFDETQAKRSREIIDEIRTDLAGGRASVTSASEGGAVVRQEINEEAEQLLVAIDDAYAAASGSRATISRKGLDTIGNVRNELAERGFEINPEIFPAASKSLNKLAKLKNKKVVSKSVSELDTIRKVLSNNINAAKTRADKFAAALIKKRFDKFLDDAFDNALFDGDEVALELLKKARGLRAEFGKRFQENIKRTRSGKSIPDPGGKTVESILERSPSDENIMNMIFGRARFFNDNNAVKVVDSIRAASNNSPAVDAALKEVAFARMTAPALKGGGFNPKKFVDAMSEVFNKSPALMRSIFTKTEIRKFMEFKGLVNRTITKGTARAPTSRAKKQLTSAFTSLMGAIGLAKGGLRGGAIGRQAAASVTSEIGTRAATRQALSATSSTIPRLPTRVNPFVISGIIGSVRPLLPETRKR